MTIAAYGRTSSLLQAEANGSQAQRHAITEWAKSRGIDPDTIQWYTDDGVSGKSMSRPEFNRLMADLRAGQVSTIVAYSMSRIGRTTRGLLEFADECRQRGVEMVFLKDQIDTSTPTGRCFLTIFAAFAELERETIAERVSGGLKAVCASGKRWGTNKPKATREQAEDAIARLGIKGACEELKVSRAGLYRAKRRKALVPV